MDNPGVAKRSGVVQLPLHIRWSEPSLSYNLDDRGDRIRVYEQVVREGTDADVIEYIDVNQLFELWDDLVLPNNVRSAWADWFRLHRQVELEC